VPTPRRHRAYHWINAADRQLIHLMLDAGYSQSAIARRIGCTRPAIYYLLKRESRDGERAAAAQGS
jgi:IS30 family transposase